MGSVIPPSDKNTINLKLAEIIKHMREEQQLRLLKQLLEGNLRPTLYRLIGKMTGAQQSALLEKLQEQPLNASPEETEIALRGHNRKSCMLSVDYRVQGHDYEGYMLDISPAGAFIETGEAFAAGQGIEISLSLPNSPGQLKISGEILWKGLLGIGVRFSDIANEQIELIKDFIGNEEM